MTSKLILGIDAGGTKTLAQLARCHPDGSWHLLAQATAAAANWSSNRQQAQYHLQEAIGQVLHQAQLESGAIDSACLAVAGAGRLGEQEQLRRWALQEGVARRVRVVHDAAAVLAAATAGRCCGVAVIAGTGSLVWGRDAGGREARALGWGPLLGDPGSGYALATQALRRVARELDQERQPSSLLAQEVLHQLGVSDPEEFLPSLYRPEMDRPRLAQLAPVVLRCAQEGCPQARGLVEAQAQRLTWAAAQVLERLIWEEVPVLALAGGVLVGDCGYRELFLAALNSHYGRPLQVHLVEQPVQGALCLAAQG